ncbi:MAG: bifunctional adenosylcobinamide kinase/adenosylcobinamide-phosphate guanylyltransferase [Microcoleaceae cyanobacterium]
MTTSLTLVSGPARSGKSEWAEKLAINIAENSEKSIIYVATAIIATDDPEWQLRIKQHQERRPSDWQTINEPYELSAVITSFSQTESCLLIDSLGTWLTNFLETDQLTWEKIVDELLNTLQQVLQNGNCHLIFVSEETGWGLVPAYPIGRLFRDRLGSLTRKIGAIAQPVYLVTAGHVLNLSNLGTPLTNY